MYWDLLPLCLEFLYEDLSVCLRNCITLQSVLRFCHFFCYCKAFKKSPLLLFLAQQGASSSTGDNAKIVGLYPYNICIISSLCIYSVYSSYYRQTISPLSYTITFDPISFLAWDPLEGLLLSFKKKIHLKLFMLHLKTLNLTLSF